MELVQLRTRRSAIPALGPLEGALADAIGDSDRVLARPIDVVAFASDASVYRLVPRAVVRPTTEAEVARLFAVSHAQEVPLTFRAAGTSLSGQAVTDGVLVDLAFGWGAIEALDGGRRVRVEPGAIGGHVNALLGRSGRRIGPDPASIDVCMMGGILANNASGMCCGVADNAYHTLESIRFVLPSGLTIDTKDPSAPALLRARAPALHAGLLRLRERVLADAALVSRIRAKYRIKNTTGYALNALVDFESPIDILAHLLIGSEGTLAFISEAVLRTLPDDPAKRTGLLLFDSFTTAFEAVAPLSESGARAIEFLDDACLRTVGERDARAAGVVGLGSSAAALLVEYQCENADVLAGLRDREREALGRARPTVPPLFTEDAATRAALWKIRKGLYPAAGATKRSGQTVVIEDVAFPAARLPAATAELKTLLSAHRYRALLFGHAKDGNCHFVITPSFDNPNDVARYERFMADLVGLVLSHDGSLKAEHGTGRNIAPFVEAEWGREAYAIMREIKGLVDPRGLLNPGVLLSDDPRAHVTHLKSLPTVDPEVDRCVECGFCEPVCPSRRLTLTPRQRIAVRRELARPLDPAVRASLERDFAYAGVDTCAADGMCETVCPVHIDTGALIKRLRSERHGPRARAFAGWLAARFAWLERGARVALRAGHLAERIVGARAIEVATRRLGRLSGVELPLWSAAIPRVPPRASRARAEREPEAIFFPSCMTRAMGLPRGESASVTELVLRLGARAGVSLGVSDGGCCGLAFGSKGYVEAHALLANRLVESLWSASRGGKLPVVFDGTSCLHSMLHRHPLSPESERKLASMRLVDLGAFVRDVLVPRLPLRRLDRRVVLHPTCASRKLDQGAALRDVAAMCASHVEVPIALGCCAMAGDRGLLFPELPDAAVAKERAEVLSMRDVASPVDGWYTNNLPCGIGMTQATGVPYLSFLYLVAEATRSDGEGAR